MRSRSRTSAAEPIAITGIGCRFPSADGPDEFWALIRDGVDAITEVPPDRFDIDAVYDSRPSARGKLISRCGGFISRPDEFDSAFFSISPREALRMDPQQRLLLEVAWEALEDAGHVVDAASRERIGVFIGVINNDYRTLLLQHPELYDVHASAGIANAMLAGRVSYALGFEGPSITVDTACSSSMVAVHAACEALRSDECEVALVGGTNLVLMPELSICFSQSGMLAADGRCKFGDATADGFVRSDGVAVVVLKRLSIARRQREHIYAVVRGSAVNNDGRSGGGLLMTPSGMGQEGVLLAACDQAGVVPADLQYIEAHGTGTSVGDPIEIETLGRVLLKGGRKDPCPIGSVKTNIGHTEATAGLAGLIKVALSLQHEVIPPSLHYRSPNPSISWASLPLRIQTEGTPWPANKGGRLAGVNSFGISGTNAHVVVEGAPQIPARRTVSRRAAHLLVISAREPNALTAMAQRYSKLLATDSRPIADICYTAAVHRAHQEHRLAVVGGSGPEIAADLRHFVEGEQPVKVSTGRIRSGKRPQIAFLFPGQGSQWAGMGAELMRLEPCFREVIERCAASFRPYVTWDLVRELTAGETDSRLAEIDVVQPALFSIEVALAALWRSWGIEPDAVIGHSMGEVAASYVSGALSLDDAARVICRRSQLATRIKGRGTMATLALPIHQARSLIAGHEGAVSIAANNGPSTTIVSGERQVIQELVAATETQGIFAWPIQVDFASHSPQVDVLREPLVSELRNIAPRVPEIRMFSTVTGDECDANLLDAAYWFRNLREPVLLWETVKRLVASGYDTFIEVSPHPILVSGLQEGLHSSEHPVDLFPSLRRREGEQSALLKTLGALHTRGAAVRFDAMHGSDRNVVPLPRYAWQRRPHWVDGRSGNVAVADAKPRRALYRVADIGHGLMGRRLSSAVHPDTHVWERAINLTSLSYAADHQVQGSVVVPATAYLEAALIAGEDLLGPGPHTLEEFEFTKALFLSETDRVIQVVCHPHTTGATRVSIFSRSADALPDAGSWTAHASGVIRRGIQPGNGARVSLGQALARCHGELQRDEFYAFTDRIGLHYGPGFQGVTSLALGVGEVVGRIETTDAIASELAHSPVHPAVLDACLQVVAGMFAGDATTANTGDVHVPVGIERLVVYRQPGRTMHSHARTRADSGTGRRLTDVSIFTDDGDPVAEVTGLELRRIDGLTEGPNSWRPEDVTYALTWEMLGDEESGSPGGADGTTWLIFADGNGVAEALAKQVRLSAGRAVLVHAGARFQADSTHDAYTVDPGSSEHFENLLQEVVAGSHTRVLRFVHFWNLDLPSARDSHSSLHDAERLGVMSVVQLVQAIQAIQAIAGDLRLLIVTQGVHALEADAIVNVEQAPAWGLGRVIANEHPELQCKLIDLDPAGSNVAALYHELVRSDSERQIVLRGGKRFGARLDRADHVSTPSRGLRTIEVATDKPFRLESATPGVLDGLKLRASERPTALPGCVVIRVRAAAMNFIDVMSAMGMVPNYGRFEGPLGIECAGLVVDVGDGVDRFRPGDKVIALAPNAIASYTMTDAHCVAPMPLGMSFEEAATIPVAFVTAYYSLVRLARLQKNERVLIHSAAGGVGLAAVQIAQSIGARVLATAGTDEKRDYLRSIGVEHVMDSRARAWAEEVMLQTAGAGVDVVLNSLAGDAIPAGLNVLRPGGRFVEIGKRDIYDHRRLDLYPFRANLAYFAVNLDRGTRDTPELFGSVLSEVMPYFEAGKLQLLPSRVFPIQEVGQAFRYMALGKHIGKIVLSLDVEHVEVELAGDTAQFRADATYVITGGLGGLGLIVARWMAEQGARKLVLLGRSAPTSEAETRLAEIREMGTEVVVARADISDLAQLGPLFASFDSDGPPLRGVVHCAMVLDDGVLSQLDASRFARVMAPKVRGGWNLHLLTSERRLDFFVMFSSAAALLGSPGQANYSAANAFLDALAYYRRAMGLPAVSVDWGAWAEVGKAATPDRGGRLQARGVGSISPEHGLEALGRLLSSQLPQVAIMPFDAARWTEHYPAAAASALFTRIAEARLSHMPSGNQPSARVREAITAGDTDAALRLVREALAEHAGRVLGQSAAAVDQEKPLTALGIDSLMAVELKNRMQMNFGVEIPATALLKGPTLIELGQEVLAKLRAQLATSDRSPAAPSEAHSEATTASPLDADHAKDLLKRLDMMSDAEVERALATLQGSANG